MPRGGPPRRPGAREGPGCRRARRALPSPPRAHSHAPRAVAQASMGFCIAVLEVYAFARVALYWRALRMADRGGARRAVAGLRRVALSGGVVRRGSVGVFGGGIIGSVTAYELARAGCAV